MGDYQSELAEEGVKGNDPTIGSYNNYQLSPNGIPSGNQRWYGLVYKWVVNLGQSLRNG